MLLLMVIRTDWATKLDHKVMAELIERYVSRHGNARASLRYLEKATNATRANVVASLRRLVDNRAIELVREGQGTRPSEYRPNFGFSSGIAGDTSSSGIVYDTTTETSGIAGNTPSGSVGDTSNRSSGIAGNTESLLLVPVTTGDKVRDTSAAGTGSGLSAAPARASDRVTRIVASEIQKDEEDDSLWLHMEFEVDGGAREPYAICIHSNDQATQDRGTKRIERLKIALGIDEIGEPSDVIGVPLLLTASDDFLPLEAT
ncbi:hypothetical protein SAMN05216358_3221 [Rhizobium sp. AN5]|nr:hypothetical protein SAMN05216358_3221 [Rhizobium sp. AN5]